MNSVEEYIAQFEPETQDRLKLMRKTFFEVPLHTEESIRYNMPAYKVGKHHLYFSVQQHRTGKININESV